MNEYDECNLFSVLRTFNIFRVKDSTHSVLMPRQFSMRSSLRTGQPNERLFTSSSLGKCTLLRWIISRLGKCKHTGTSKANGPSSFKTASVSLERNSVGRKTGSNWLVKIIS
uniref:Uncharacterized protein n=1 Tax=Opuntia streptacantha TaxID=393608 RepID=A0A7C9A4Y9_OPUST